MVRAWYMDDSDADKRLEHHLDPAQLVTLDKLGELGILSWTFDPANYDRDAAFANLKEQRGYCYQDQIECSPGKLADFEQKMAAFYQEHFHADEEIRFVLDGSGYLDVRDLDDCWIRIQLTRGDLIVLPAGLYHRFTLDSGNYIKALRLFVGTPVWTAYPRSPSSEADHPSVRSYRQTFGRRCTAANAKAAC